MEARPPTQEQVKEFWEGCVPGFFDQWAPELDLNNLFKYAVPKLNGRYKLEGTSGYHFATVWKDPIAFVEIRDTDPADALFWAIWEVIKKDGS